MKLYSYNSRSTLLQTVAPCVVSLLIYLLLTISARAIHDTNQNGASDLWERKYNSGNLFATFDPAADPDGDSWTNEQEAVTGTNPFDGNALVGFLRPEIEHIPAVYITPEVEGGEPEILSPETTTITWPTLAGKQYTLFASTDLSPGSWTTIGTPDIGSGTRMGAAISLTQSDGSIPNKLFMRISVLDVDQDSDTLTNAEEAELGSLPYSADGDNDGLSDLEELFTYQTSAVASDSDGDGVSDPDEILVNFTDPLTATDADGDGIPDDFEKHFACQLQAYEPDATHWGVYHAGLLAGNLDANHDYTGEGMSVRELAEILKKIPAAGPANSGYVVEQQARRNSIQWAYYFPPPSSSSSTGTYFHSVPDDFDVGQEITPTADLGSEYLLSRIDEVTWSGVAMTAGDQMSFYNGMVESGFRSTPVLSPDGTKFQGLISQQRCRLIATNVGHEEYSRNYIKVIKDGRYFSWDHSGVIAVEPLTVQFPKGRVLSDWYEFKAPMVDGSEGRSAEVFVHPVELAVDNNRAGKLDLNATSDKTTSEKPYRFWLNNDHDNYADDTYDDQQDHPWTTQSLDSSNNPIESQRDLDDLARLHLKVEGIQSALEDGSMTLGIKWKTTISGEPRIRIFKAGEADGGTKYLSDAAEAANQIADGRTALGVVQGAAVFDLPVSFWTSTSASSKKHFLFEGLGEGKGELTLVFKKDGSVIGEAGSVFLELIDIRKMYERWQIAAGANFPGPDLITATPVSGITSVADPNGHPFQAAWDEDLEDKSYIACVHGWRKNYNGARSDEITMFKRLWHRGFKGRYAGYYWPTLTGGPVGAKFNHSEYRAWKCGAAFKDFIETQLPSGYRKCVIAHSLGNVMVGSALSQGLVLDRYALLNGAIPAQCFDPDPALKQTAATQTLATGLGWPATVSYDAWAGGDLSDDPLAALRGLAYRSRVSTVGETKLINFFLTADTAINAWEANQWAAGDGVPGIDSKPVDGYEYDIGVRLNYDPIGIGDRVLTDTHEAMAMANQSMTKAVGGEGRTAGAISGSVDMNGAGMLFGKEHQAAFQFVPSKTWEFYRQLLTKLGFSPTP